MLKPMPRAWPVPAALIAFALLPIVTSIMRVVEIAGGPVETADNARFLVLPVQIYLHGGGGALYLLLGAFQFSAVLRARRPWLHRVTGRIAIMGGALSALSALWMTETFPNVPFNPDEVYGFRVVFSLAWLACLAFGVLAAFERDFAAHRAWMMRAYAIGLGGSTTAVLLGSWIVVYGTPSPKVFALATGAAWIVNLCVTQAILRTWPMRGKGKPLAYYDAPPKMKKAGTAT